MSRSFCLHVPSNLPMAAAAPLLCAGITVYSPLRHYNLDKPGLKIGVVGLGGLGHMVRLCPVPHARKDVKIVHAVTRAVRREATDTPTTARHSYPEV